MWNLRHFTPRALLRTKARLPSFAITCTHGKVFSAALDQNSPDLLNADFVGSAKDKLTDTIRQQAALGIRTQYQDRSHDLQIVFYSPEGMSIELTDKVEYDVQVIDHDKVISTQRESARYLVVLAPSRSQVESQSVPVNTRLTPSNWIVSCCRIGQ